MEPSIRAPHPFREHHDPSIRYFCLTCFHELDIEGYAQPGRCPIHDLDLADSWSAGFVMPSRQPLRLTSGEPLSGMDLFGWATWWISVGLTSGALLVGKAPLVEKLKLILLLALFLIGFFVKNVGRLTRPA